MAQDGKTLLWNVGGVKGWPQLGQPVRVIRSLEEKGVRERVSGSWVNRTIIRDWMWVTLLPKEVESTQIARWGHKRWDIETRGFGELAQHWNLEHCYRHSPTAITANLLILFTTFSLTRTFFEKNLKSPLRLRFTRIFLASLFNDDLAKSQEVSFWARTP